jgi:DNA-binding NarL/FixJ family response regulator
MMVAMNAPEQVLPQAPVRTRARVARFGRPEPRSEPARLLVVSDQSVLRDAWASLFEAQGYHVAGLAHSLAELLTAAASTMPDAILLDLPMDEVSARRTVAGLREQLGCHATVVARWKRDGFLLSTGRGLPEAVPHPGTHELLTTLDRSLGRARAKTPAPITNGCDPLTPRELEVLERMASGITTNRDLANALEVSENTVGASAP